jgi:RNA polymerase sigma factor (sigma-70 family)
MQATATDFQLLSEFAAAGDETAFATIVHRHGAMVRGVGRRILGDPAGADDAFQATFISLARHAKSLAETEQCTDSLGSWLYRVAVNAALQQKRKAKSRRRCETTFAEQRQTDLRARAARDEWLPVLDEEIGALPDRYQSPLVLCHLEGRTQQDAADELGLTYATIRRRLKQAKILLRERLQRRGLSEAGVLVLPLLAQAAALSTAPAQAAVQTATTAALSQSAAATSAVSSTAATTAASSTAASTTAATAGTVKATAGGLTALLSGKSTALTLTVLGGLTAGLCAATLAWDAPGERLAARRAAEPNLPRSTATVPAEVDQPTTDAPAPRDATPTDDAAEFKAAPVDFQPLPKLQEATAAIVIPPKPPVDDDEVRLVSAITPELLAGKGELDVDPAADPPLAVAAVGSETTAADAADVNDVSGVIDVLERQRARIAQGPLEPPARPTAGEPRVFKGTVALEGREQRFYTNEQADALLDWLEQQPAPPADGFRAAFHIDGRTFEVRDFGLALDVLRDKRPLD